MNRFFKSMCKRQEDDGTQGEEFEFEKKRSPTQKEKKKREKKVWVLC